MKQPKSRKQQKNQNRAAAQSGSKPAGSQLSSGQSIDIEQALQAAHAHHQAGRLQQAEAGYRQILTMYPQHPYTMHLLGVVAAQTAHHDEAVELITKAILLKGNEANFYSNLGESLRALGHNDRAIECFNRAVILQPNFAVAHFNLGNTLLQQAMLDKAEESFIRAIELKPDFPVAYQYLGQVRYQQGRVSEAIADFRQAVALAPDAPSIHSSLLFTLYSDPDSSPAQSLAEHRKWSERDEKPRLRLWLPHKNLPDPHRPLHIGYVSPDLRNHPVFRFLLPLLQHHNRSRFRITCYADVPQPDASTAQLRELTDYWYQTAGWPEERLADRIRADGIDILVDLSLHTAFNRLPVFARKPAPVQVSWLGMPGTTGLDAMDYRLTDPFLDPPGTDTDYSETSLRLPDSVWCYAAPEGGPDVNAPSALSAGYVTFISLNAFGKVNARVLKLWAAVLRAVPNSRLIVLAEIGRHRRTTLEVLQANGVNNARVEFDIRRGHLAHLALHHDVDIALDTFPYSGHTTTCDALWMGVPVVSLAGQTAVGRGGASILSNVGLAKLIAHSEEEYVQIATDLAADLPHLANIRVGLRDQMQRSPLMDGPRFAKAVETSYHMMWRKWCTESALVGHSVSYNKA